MPFKKYHFKADFMFEAKDIPDAYNELAKYFGTLADPDFIEHDIITHGKYEIKAVEES